MKNIFLIIGAPGSGKTTDASLIAKSNQSIAHYSTGDLLRAQVANGSKLGKKIDSFISNGNLVPLEIVVSAIIGAIKDCKSDYILLDGYPRSCEQMSEFDKVLKSEKDLKLKAVIEVDVSEKVAKDRVLGRSRGTDDNEEVFYNRMKVFTEPIIEIRKFYKEKGIYHSINAERTIEEIVNDMNELIVSIILKG